MTHQISTRVKHLKSPKGHFFVFFVTAWATTEEPYMLVGYRRARLARLIRLRVDKSTF